KAFQKPRGESAAQAARTPACILSHGGSTPILPVEDGNTRFSLIPRVRATKAQASRAKRNPSWPVATLAIPLLTTTACRHPVLLRSRPTSTGAAVDLLVVKAATAVAGTSETISARSFFPLGLIPQATPANRNPGTTINRFSTLTRISSPHAFPLRPQHSSLTTASATMTLLVFLATATRTRVVAADFRGLALDLLRLGLDRCPTVAHQHLPLGRTPRLLNALRVLLAGDLYGEELLDNVFLQPL